jgi:sterol desaturase/sphingolipid hydroxylase (fatty acid hydroxylase superfamily)
MELSLRVIARLADLAPWLVLGMALEQVALADPRRPFRSAPFNLVYLVIVTAWQVVMFAAVSAYFARLFAALPTVVDLRLPPDAPRWWILAVGFACLMLRDFFYYWFHRLQHASKWLWWEHELHHSDPNMNVTTGARHHWVEMPLLIVFQIVPFMLLVRMDPAIAFAASLCGDVLGCFTHMNTRVSLGRLAWVVTNPQLHRIHHSVEPQHWNRNFAAYCPLWDVLFGTYYAPQPGEFPATGLRSGYVPNWLQAFAIRLPRRAK